MRIAGPVPGEWEQFKALDQRAEMLVGRDGFKEIRLAYPVADEQNLQRGLKLCEKDNLIFCVNSEETATLMSEAFGRAGKSADCVIKIDVRVHTGFGVESKKAGDLAKRPLMGIKI